ncbi:MAG: class I SAM-dependent methyltransferase [Crocinitomicaceae bacterium]|nr:class I SAM-dependent methyltransferase [Crocinitomicaceae bacterium]
MEDKKEHWESIFANKALDEVSWYEPSPTFSIELFHQYVSNKSASVLNVGGGDSLLFDYLVKDGYENLHLLDISSNAIERAKERLADTGESINYIVSDITAFEPTQIYDVWFDRAAFHFLTDPLSIKKYIDVLNASTNSDSVIIIGTFSKDGPQKCSGIEIQQYNESDFKNLFESSFEVLEVLNVDHETPSETVQNFNFAILKKK